MMTDAITPQITAIPKLFRQRNKDQKEVGNWYVKIANKPINLQTQDYFKARERAREAVTGKRDFTDDRFFGESPPETAPSTSAPTPSAPAGDWTSDATRAASVSLTPDAIFPPGLPPIPNAEQPPGASPFDSPPRPDEKPGIGADSTSLPPEMLDNLVKQIAQTVVELQIQGQEYLAIRWGKFQPGTVPPDSKARELPVKIWEEQIRKWIPTDVPLPAWVVAPVLCAMLTIPVQLEGATSLKQKEAPAQ